MDKNSAPAQPSVFDQAVALYQQGQFQAALAVARQGLANFANVAGAAARQLGLTTEAERYWRAAIAARPDFTEAHNNLGVLLQDRGLLDEAENAYRQALALNPQHADAYNNLGNVLRDRKQFEQAENAYCQALALNPRHAGAHTNLGSLLRVLGRLEDAETAFRNAIKANASFADAYNHLGAVLHDRGRMEEAEAAYRQALALRPHYADAYHNLGILLHGCCRLAQAEAAYRQALHLRPGYVDAQYNFSLLLLAMGRFAEGWALYESRYAPSITKPVVGLPALTIPKWAGEPLAEKTFLVIPEQGFGDQIQFCRYVALLKRRGARRVDIVCDRSLTALFETLDGVDRVITAGDHASDGNQYDHWTFILSIPLHCKTAIDTIPGDLPYLRPRPERVDHWLARLPRGGLRVGLVWKGQPQYHNDTNRSLPGLSALAPLWSVPGIVFVSLQKGVGEDEAAGPPEGQPLVPLGSAIRDFADSAAIVSLLDLVICVDTAVAHLVGALGKPCWVLLPNIADWRWLLERTDSPWYPGVMRLFRQPTPGDWAAVVHEVVQCLRAYTMRR